MARYDCWIKSFNPRSPWEERPSPFLIFNLYNLFQSTLPWEERHHQSTTPLDDSQFQSTLPVGGATLLCPAYQSGENVSIHAPRGRSDQLAVEYVGTDCYSFNPRSPWEERPCWSDFSVQESCFNPRSPWEERLTWKDPNDISIGVSIHAPRGRSDK